MTSTARRVSRISRLSANLARRERTGTRPRSELRVGALELAEADKLHYYRKRKKGKSKDVVEEEEEEIVDPETGA